MSKLASLMSRSRLTRLALAAFGLLLSAGGAAAACTTYPNSLTNGTTADGSQVIANLAYMSGCLAPQASPIFTAGMVLSLSGGGDFDLYANNTAYSTSLTIRTVAASQQAALLKTYQPVAHFTRHLIIPKIRLGDWEAETPAAETSTAPPQR